MLGECLRIFAEARKHVKAFPSLADVGAYQAALEEYAEAQLFLGFLKTGEAIDLKDPSIHAEIYAAALSDAVGEAVRWARMRAAEGDGQAVRVAADYARQAVDFFLSLDVSGYLRTKSDQCKKHLHSVEMMLYDQSLRSL